MARAATELTVKESWRRALRRVVGPIHTRRGGADQRAETRVTPPGAGGDPPLVSPRQRPAPRETDRARAAANTGAQPLRPRVLDVSPAPLPAAIEGELVSPPVPVRATAPREWNLWELEAMAREDAGRDELRDEERSLVLLHLRPFASAKGVLPVNFDDLVRESFGELLAARESG
jgi:hypothetical protein